MRGYLFYVSYNQLVRSCLGCFAQVEVLDVVLGNIFF